MELTCAPGALALLGGKGRDGRCFHGGFAWCSAGSGKAASIEADEGGLPGGGGSGWHKGRQILVNTEELGLVRAEPRMG